MEYIDFDPVLFNLETESGKEEAVGQIEQVIQENLRRLTLPQKTDLKIAIEKVAKNTNGMDDLKLKMIFDEKFLKHGKQIIALRLLARNNISSALMAAFLYNQLKIAALIDETSFIPLRRITKELTKKIYSAVEDPTASKIDDAFEAFIQFREETKPKDLIPLAAAVEKFRRARKFFTTAIQDDKLKSYRCSTAKNTSPHLLSEAEISAYIKQ